MEETEQQKSKICIMNNFNVLLLYCLVYYYQTKNELSDSKEKRAAMEMELCLMADKLRHHEEHLCKQEEEIEELRNCLSQVTSQTAELASLSANSSGENVKEMDQHVVDEKGDMHVQLSNVQNLLDGFQVREHYLS